MLEMAPPLPIPGGTSTSGAGGVGQPMLGGTSTSGAGGAGDAMTSEPANKANAELQQALADTFLQTIDLHTQLKQSQLESNGRWN